MTDASKAGSQWTQCEGKVAFDSPQLARKAAKRRKNREAYRCQYCGKWHTGTQRTKGRKIW